MAHFNQRVFLVTFYELHCIYKCYYCREMVKNNLFMETRFFRNYICLYVIYLNMFTYRLYCCDSYNRTHISVLYIEYKLNWAKKKLMYFICFSYYLGQTCIQQLLTEKKELPHFIIWRIWFTHFEYQQLNFSNVRGTIISRAKLLF